MIGARISIMAMEEEQHEEEEEEDGSGGLQRAQMNGFFWRHGRC